MKKKEKKIKIVQGVLAVALALILTVPMVAAIPLPVTVQGITYGDGTLVPDGWIVSMENLDEDYGDEPWTATTQAGVGTPSIYNWKGSHHRAP